MQAYRTRSLQHRDSAASYRGPGTNVSDDVAAHNAWMSRLHEFFADEYLTMANLIQGLGPRAAVIIKRDPEPSPATHPTGDET